MARDVEDASRAVNDAWTGMLAISLLVLIGGCVLLWLDFSHYPSTDPPKRITAPAVIAAPKGDPPAPKEPPAKDPAPPAKDAKDPKGM